MLSPDQSPRPRFRLPRFESVFSRRLLGIGVLLSIAVGLLVAVVRPDPFHDTRTYYAEFDSAKGIGRVDRDVRVAGLNVGEIGEIRRVGDDVVVELDIEGDLPVKEDATAEIRPHTLFEGSAFVDLHPGSPSAPSLSDGATIPRSQTEVYVSLDEALRVLHTPTRNALRDLAEVGAKTLEPRAIEGLQRTLRSSDELVAGLAPTMRAIRGPEGDELGGAIQGLAKTTQAVGWREADLLPLVQRTRATLAALDVDGGARLDAALAALPGVLEELRDGGPRLLHTIDRLDALAVDAQPAFAELTPLLRELRPVVRRATPVLEQAPPLVHSLRIVLRRAAAAAPTLGELIEVFRPGARLLQKSVLPFLNSDSRLGVPTYVQLASAFTGATSALRPYQTRAQGMLGEGHVLRLSAYLDQGFFTNLPFALPGQARASGKRVAECDELSLGGEKVAKTLRDAGYCE
jgi:virulence factor Mce-like protein